MTIVGTRPETGLRIDVERPRDGGPPWRYEGQAVTPADTFGLVATVEPDGAIGVELDSRAPAPLAEKARLLLRAAWKHAQDDDLPPPRRIVRWRADR
jgi:hypothetical protein